MTRHGWRRAASLVACLGVLVGTAGLAAVDRDEHVPDDAGPRNTLRWTTSSELENFGFDVYRGPTREGPWTRITARPIRGAGTSDTIERYLFVDDTIAPETAYWYWVESISFRNVRRRYTPLIWAPPKPVAPDRGDGGARP